jgi:hypothetical protein
MADENVPGARDLTLREYRSVSVVGGTMSDEGTHAELLALLASAHEAVGQVHRYVHERRPKLNGSGIFDTPVAWRKHKSGAWAFSVHHPEKADLARRHGWEPLFVAPEDDDGSAAVGAAG